MSSERGQNCFASLIRLITTSTLIDPSKSRIQIQKQPEPFWILWHNHKTPFSIHRHIIYFQYSSNAMLIQNLSRVSSIRSPAKSLASKYFSRATSRSLSTSPWAHFEMAPTDPIVGLNEIFQKDDFPSKVIVGVGAYRDDVSLNLEISQCAISIIFLSRIWRFF